jgi:hypothetical protein
MLEKIGSADVIHEIPADASAKAVEIPEKTHARKTHALACCPHFWLPFLLQPDTSSQLPAHPPAGGSADTDIRADRQDALLGNRPSELARPYRNQNPFPGFDHELNEPVLYLAVIEQLVVLASPELRYLLPKIHSRVSAIVDPQGHITLSVLVPVKSEPDRDEWRGSPVHEPSGCSVMLHQLPPAQDVPRFGKAGNGEVHRVLPEALHHLQLDTTHPLLGRTVSAHRHHQLVPILVIPSGIVQKGPLQRRQKFPVKAPLPAVERAFEVSRERVAVRLLNASSGGCGA